MKILLKIHSSLQKLFPQQEYEINAPDYIDIYSYIYNTNPAFQRYLKSIQNGIADEGIALVDSKFRVIDLENTFMKKPKDGDIVYLAPMILGGGGKRGFAIIAAVAIVAIGVATGGFGFAAAGGLGGTGAGTTAGLGGAFLEAGTAVAGQTVTSLGGSFLSSALGTFAKSLLGNLALAAITSIFTKRPNSPVASTTDSGTRTENNIFGSLTNTTSSGTPIALNYGLVRVAGQFLSGYLHTTQHGKSNSPSVQSIFDSAAPPNQRDVGIN